MLGGFLKPEHRKGWFSVKKFIAMLLMGAVLVGGSIGCGDEKKAPAKDKDKPAAGADKDKAKDKDKTP